MIASTPVRGFTTTFVFRLKPGASADQVVAFYSGRLLPGWRLVQSLQGPVPNFRRGNTVVSVNLESWRRRILEIVVDYDQDAKFSR